MTFDLHSSETPRASPPKSRPFQASAPPALWQTKDVCRIVRQVVGEIISLTGDRSLTRWDRRRMLCHVRQIAMYVCHVSLSIPLTDIGQAFGRDRTTVGHACHVVEDRRDDAAFDDFVTGIERIVGIIFAVRGEQDHD